MLKNVVSAPGWLKTPDVDRVYSVSGCVSPYFMNYVPLWRHNGWWFFDALTTLDEIAATHGLDRSALTLFFYEVFEREYDDEDAEWRPVGPDADQVTNVQVPHTKSLCGFDVVTFWAQSAPECSPLSCNGLAKDMPVNRNCLFDDFDVAHDLVGRGAFNRSEPGPYRIFAVYTVSPS